MEYLHAATGTNGKKFVYELAWDGKDEESPALRELVDVEKLKQLLDKKKGDDDEQS